MPQPTLHSPQGVLPKRIINFRRSSPPLDRSAAPPAHHNGKDHHHHQNRFHAMDIFHLNQDKRKSSASRTSGERTPQALSPKVGPVKPAHLTISIESPPLVSYGNIQGSSGALLSGQLALNVTEPELKVESFSMELLARVTVKRPVVKDCAGCTTQTISLKTWTFISEPTTFEKGPRSCPFSYLLPGHLPATTASTLGSLSYVLSATAVTGLDTLTLTHPIVLKRALMPAPQDRTSVRVFPPTHLRAEVAHPPLIHPIGEFLVHLRLGGLAHDDAGDGHLSRRWRMRKLSWRVEECAELVSPACAKHAAKLGGQGKGVLHQDVRPLGTRDVREGWKTDYSVHMSDDAGGRGATEIEFPCSLNLKNLTPPPVCDVEDPSGLQVTHRLCVELVVAEEVAAKNVRNPQWNGSGTARVLRMQFAVGLTERAGLGVSWDEEMPPMYEDVPGSPPGYARMEEYVGEVIPANDLDLQR